MQFLFEPHFTPRVWGLGLHLILNFTKRKERLFENSSFYLGMMLGPLSLEVSTVN